ncbi:MAG: proprotein convertase P-domain-containing protein, partial [Bacteroidota bacterium]
MTTLNTYFFHLILLFGCFSFLPSTTQAQVCGCIDCPAPIPIFDNLQTLDYVVAGLDNDDLSGSQCVESVSIQFQHNRVQNLTIELISPSGQIIPLVGPYQQFGGGLNGTLGAVWDINFVQCFPNGQ